MQQQLNKHAQQTIAELQQVCQVLWRRCCEEDGVDPDSKFVVFSENNKFVPFHNRAMQQLMEAREQYRQGGYVGLRIERGRTKL